MTIDQWFPFIKLPMSFEQFRQLPQHPAYKYEYSRGSAELTARPKSYHGLLSLQPRNPPLSVRGFGRETVTFRPLQNDDWLCLPRLFAEAFDHVPPYSQLADEDRLSAAEQCLSQTRDGGDGLLIQPACFVARCDTAEGERRLGAILVTLLPAGDLEDFGDDAWTMSPPPDPIEQKWGRPHLTWIFTNYWNARHGIGTALLDCAVNALLELGYLELGSTFLLGNDASTLWHWKNDFRLLSSPGSPRVWKQRHPAD